MKIFFIAALILIPLPVMGAVIQPGVTSSLSSYEPPPEMRGPKRTSGTGGR
jgi:hypothetical protein